MTLRVGLISDTHGLLRPQALAFLRGSSHIIHAGDIVDPAILDALAALAPLTAVRGNNDFGDWAGKLPEAVSVTLGGVLIHVIHDLNELAVDPATQCVRVVVAGHTHKPASVKRDGVLYVNPCSAGRRRFTLPISVGELLIDEGRVEVRLVTLDVE